MIPGGRKYKRRRAKRIGVVQKRPDAPNRSPQQIEADKAKAKRARRARAKQRGKP
jgi:hypothetical protein